MGIGIIGAAIQPYLVPQTEGGKLSGIRSANLETAVTGRPEDSRNQYGWHVRITVEDDSEEDDD